VEDIPDKERADERGVAYPVLVDFRSGRFSGVEVRINFYQRDNPDILGEDRV